MGGDYLYYGRTEFRGVHNHQPLIDHRSDQPVQTEKVNGRVPAKLRELDIFPEHYLIPVRVFEDVIASGLDEWIYMFKHSRVPDTFKAKNIDQAREKLAVLRMSAGELKTYDAYLWAKRHDEEKLAGAREEGREEERANTEREHQRAEAERRRAEELDRRVKELEAQLLKRHPAPGEDAPNPTGFGLPNP